MEQLRLIARFLWPWVRRYRLRLAGAVLAGALFGASNAGVLWLTRTVLERLEDDPAPAAESVEAAPGEGLAAEAGAVDRFLDRWLPRRGEPAGMLQYLSLILGLPLLISIRSSWEYLSAYWMSWVGERVVNDLRVKVLGKLSGLPLGYFDKAKMGDMITRINGDTLMLQNCITHGIKNSVSHPVTVLVVFLYLVRMDWQLMLGIAALLPGTLVPLLIFGRKARAASAGRVRANVVQSSLLVEMLSAIRVVKAYCLESREVERFRNLSRQIFSHTMRGVRAQEIVGPIIETLSMLAVGTLIVFVILTDRSIADLVTFFAGLFMFYESIKKLAKLHVLFSQTSVGVQRLESILAEQPEVADPGRGLPVDRFERGIRFQGVSFAYREEQVLEDIDLAIPRGTRLGIAGESGSGKTTLIHLLLRFFEPDRGADPARRGRSRGSEGEGLPAADGPGQPGRGGLRPVGGGQHRLRTRRRHPGGDREGGGAGPRHRIHPRAGARLRHLAGGAGGDPVGRAAPAHRHRPGLRPGRPHPDPGRGHRLAGRQV